MEGIVGKWKLIYMSKTMNNVLKEFGVKAECFEMVHQLLMEAITYYKVEKNIIYVSYESNGKIIQQDTFRAGEYTTTIGVDGNPIQLYFTYGNGEVNIIEKDDKGNKLTAFMRPEGNKLYMEYTCNGATALKLLEKMP